MKTTFFNGKILFILSVLSICFGFTAMGYGQATVVSVNPATMESPAVGEQFTVSIDITDGRNVSGYQVTINFDPTALKYVSNANANYLPAGALTVQPVITNNSVTIAALAAGATAPDGDGTLATVVFEVIAEKASSIELTSIRLVDTLANQLAVTTEDGMVTVPAIQNQDPLEGADVVLIIDSSGSMAENDPNDLRKTAAKHFIDLADPLIQIAIVDFNGSAKTYADLTFADSAGKSQLKSAVDRIDSGGDTDIGEGLALGYRLLAASSSPDVIKKAAVLLTDGRDNSFNLTSSYIQNYVAQGWDVYTVGLGNGVDRGLLEDIAESTSEGEYFPASLENIQTIFNRIFTSVTKETVIFNNIGFINQNQQITKKFVLDGSVEQIVSSANWQGSTIELVLIDPNGVEITPQDAAANPNITYQAAPTNAIYTVENPMPGEWGLQATGTDIPPGGEQYNLIVAATSDFVINLLSFEPSYVIGDTLRIGIRARRKNGQNVEPVLGATTTAEIVRPDGRIDSLDLLDVTGDGTYVNEYTGVDIEGTYLIRATVQNGFSREIQEQIVVGDITNVFIDGSTLTPAAGATLDLSPNVISAVISGPAGGIDSNSIVLQVDGTTVTHGYDAVNQLVLFRPPSLSAGTHTVKLSVNNNLETTWEFSVTVPESRFDLLLDPGLNVVSLPLMQREPYTAKSFSELLGATVIIRHDSASQAYIAYVAADPNATDEGFAIEGGRGYIVNTPTTTTITFIGTAWSNQPIAGAPSTHIGTTAWAFVLSSDVRGMEPDTSYIVTAKNLRTGAVVTEDISIGQRSSNAVWADMNRKSVVQADDIVEITLHDRQGNTVSGPFQQKVSTADIQNAYMRVQMKVGNVRPKDTILAQNYPNPFNPETWIPYQLSKPAKVSIQIYDNSGHSIRTLDVGLKSAGIYMAPTQAAYWDGKNNLGERVASGIYYYTLKTSEFTATRKMVILK